MRFVSSRLSLSLAINEYTTSDVTVPRNRTSEASAVVCLQDRGTYAQAMPTRRSKRCRVATDIVPQVVHSDEQRADCNSRHSIRQPEFIHGLLPLHMKPIDTLNSFSLLVQTVKSCASSWLTVCGICVSGTLNIRMREHTDSAEHSHYCSICHVDEYVCVYMNS